MKCNKLLFSLCPLSVLLLGLGPSKASPVPLYSFNFSPIGPLEIGGEDYTFTGTARASRNMSGVRESFYVYITGQSTPVYFTRTAAHSVSSRAAVDLTFTLPVKDYLTSAGFTCSLEVTNSSDSIVQRLSFNIKPITESTINVNNYTSSYCSFPDTIVDPDGSYATPYERFMFDNFIDYFDVDNYHRLIIKNQKITYACSKPYSGGTAYLHFVDNDRLFPDLDDRRKVPEVLIPLRIIQDGGVYFDFPSNMYVNPQSLSMSLTAKPGYMLTNYFYLPINKRSKLVDRKFTLRVKDFGHNKTSFTWDIYYTNTRDLIGDCSNSDYCVVGEVD